MPRFFIGILFFVFALNAFSESYLNSENLCARLFQNFSQEQTANLIDISGGLSKVMWPATDRFVNTIFRYRQSLRQAEFRNNAIAVSDQKIIDLANLSLETSFTLATDTLELPADQKFSRLSEADRLSQTARKMLFSLYLIQQLPKTLPANENQNFTSYDHLPKEFIKFALFKLIHMSQLFLQDSKNLSQIEAFRLNRILQFVVNEFETQTLKLNQKKSWFQIFRFGQTEVQDLGALWKQKDLVLPEVSAVIEIALAHYYDPNNPHGIFRGEQSLGVAYGHPFPLVVTQKMMSDFLN